MSGHTKSNKIRNEDIKYRVRVASMVDKMRKARLRSFEHVKRRCVNAPTRLCKRLVIKGTRRGREVFGRGD